MPSILVVCTANVCRSAFAASLLGARLAGVAEGRWRVTSAGTQARDGQPLCESVAERLSRTAGGTGTPAHEARRLTPSDIAAADIILTAETEHRAAVVRLDPAASSKTFTLREAVALARLVRRDDAGDPAALVSGSHLHAARPYLQTAMPRRRRLFAPRSEFGVDIADGHNLGPRQHVGTLDSISSTVEELAPLLSAGAWTA